MVSYKILWIGRVFRTWQDIQPVRKYSCVFVDKSSSKPLQTSRIILSKQVDKSLILKKSDFGGTSIPLWSAWCLAVTKLLRKYPAEIFRITETSLNGNIANRKSIGRNSFLPHFFCFFDGFELGIKLRVLFTDIANTHKTKWAAR